MSKIRKEISNIVGYTIPEGKYKESFDLLKREGRLQEKQIWEILTLLIQREEERESSV